MAAFSKRRLWLVAAMLLLVAVVTFKSFRHRIVESERPIQTPSVVTPGAQDADRTQPPQTAIRFELMPSEMTGIQFDYYGSPSDEHYMTEQNGGGTALFDIDSDGRMDVFLANGSHFKRPAKEAGASHRLFRQIDDWRFADITELAGLRAFGFGQGCATGDFDNDGFTDLFLANYEGNRLWHNRGDGTFAEVTEDSGVGDQSWGSSAAFADLDGDGNLDLYIVKYVDWSPDKLTAKRIPSPMDFSGLPDQLYRNLGNDRFESVGPSAGVAIAGEGKGLAVAITDLNGDDRPDIYVANDTTRNFLFRNLGGLRFEEMGVQSGCSGSQDGSLGSSMGVAVGDYNRDGHFDLFVTNFAGEVVDALTGVGPTGFVANNMELGLDAHSRPLLNFGIVLADFDADQWPDLFFANGHLWDDRTPGHQYRMLPSLLRNSRGKRFNDVSAQAGKYFRQTWLGRAVATGDLDNDGDLDLLVTHLSDPPAVLRNESERSGNVLRLKLIGLQSARQPRGMRVDILVGNEKIATHISAGESFQASHDDRLIIPIGPATQVDEVRVHWSPGSVETWSQLSVERAHALREGTGRHVPQPPKTVNHTAN